MNKGLNILVLMISGLLVCNAMADERPDHFKGKPADTLQQAVSNFSEYNQKLKNLLAAELTPQSMAEIHQLTYTIEVALEKIHTETGKLKVTLEDVHIASEHLDMATAKRSGDAYIEAAQTLVK
jgi:hypothetical protein